MSRWLGFLICALAGLAMLCCGLQVPAHLRAVDPAVLQQAGRNTRSLVEEGVALAKRQQLGATQLLLTAADSAGVTNSARLSDAVNELAWRHPELKSVGSAEAGPVGVLLQVKSVALESNSTVRPQPFSEFIIRSENRTRALARLETSSSPVVQELLKLRSVAGTTLFPASTSASGQTLDAAIAIGGLLAETGHLSTDLGQVLVELSATARHAGNSQPLEQVLLDFLSLGQRFNWGQLAAFVEPIRDAETLRIQTEFVRRGQNVPVIFAVTRLVANSAAVARYLTNFSESGLNDLRRSLVYGRGGVDELLRRQQRLCASKFCESTAALDPSGKMAVAALAYTQGAPWLALLTKWLLYLLGGFTLAAAVHFLRRVPALELPLQVPGFHVAREFLFALGFLLVVLLLSEPFLSQGRQQGFFPFRLRLPVVGSAVLAGPIGVKSSIMNPSILLTLLLFFVLQALIYVACLLKLGEIRRHRVEPRVKLKLLENEDHLFDAGLYLGFVGTIISLILFSLGVIKPSLMAAYSSTSFGIIFVSCFKIFNLRPLRRRLLLEAEVPPPTATTPMAQPAYASPS